VSAKPETTVDVVARMDARDRVNARLVRVLAEHGRPDVIDAIYRDDAPSMQCGSAPRLKAVS
jgi:hypothetical protein